MVRRKKMEQDRTRPDRTSRKVGRKEGPGPTRQSTQYTTESDRERVCEEGAGSRLPFFRSALHLSILPQASLFFYLSSSLSPSPLSRSLVSSPHTARSFSSWPWPSPLLPLFLTATHVVLHRLTSLLSTLAPPTHPTSNIQPQALAYYCLT